PDADPEWVMDSIRLTLLDPVITRFEGKTGTSLTAISLVSWHSQANNLVDMRLIPVSTVYLYTVGTPSMRGPKDPPMPLSTGGSPSTPPHPLTLFPHACSLGRGLS